MLLQTKQCFLSDNIFIFRFWYIRTRDKYHQLCECVPSQRKFVPNGAAKLEQRLVFHFHLTLRAKIFAILSCNEMEFF